ncbi:MAG: PQQ-binding-like beta-propeller repeat protein [Proteobacteria bacterium]|nr:PQQ-binding-like beta-propeller repeat protein [Pseudomonadota bacterium]
MASKIGFHSSGLDNAPAGFRIQTKKVDIGEFFESYAQAYDRTLKGEWPNFRGKDYSNISRDSVELADTWGAEGPPVMWRQHLGEGHAAPVIFRGRVYILDYLEKEKADALRCFSLTTGKEVWRRWYRVDIKRNHGRSRTSPAVNNKHVVTLGPVGQVMVVDSENGDLRWTLDLVREYGAEIPLWYTGQGPLLEDDTVVLAVGGTDVLLLGISATTGKVKWTTPNLDKWKMSHSSIVPMVIKGRRMYVYAAIGGVVGVEADGKETGRILWKTNHWAPAVVAPSPVLLPDGVIYLTAGYGAGSTTLRIVEKGNRFTVEPGRHYRPKQALSLEQQSAILYKGMLFGVLPKDAGAKRMQLVAADPGNHSKILFSADPSLRFGLCPFIIADDKIYILDAAGKLSMLKVAGKSFQILDRFKVFDGVDPWGPFAVADGIMVLRDSTSMAGLDLSKNKRWKR